MSNNDIYRSYKYRFYPTDSQKVLLSKTFGAVRFLWNHYTASFNNFNNGPTQSNASVKNFRDNYEFLKEVPYKALEQKRMDFDATKIQYFSKTRKKKLGRMQFKVKGRSRDSFRLSTSGFSINNKRPTSSVIEFNVNDRISLAKIGVIKTKIDRPWKGVAKSVTVSKNSCDQYFVSVLVKEDQPELKQNTNRSIGIDLGLKDLLSLSSGEKIHNPKFFRENQTKLKRAQQHLSRKQIGSNRYLKQKLKVARIHLKTANQRNYYLHGISSWLVNNYDHIFMETLSVSGMKKLFGKSVSDAAFAELTRQIEYKSQWSGRSFHKIDMWFPSSKNCSHCGTKNTSLELSHRDWTCSSCGTHHDRDLNAANNILVQGFMELYDISKEEALEQINKSAEYVDYRHGEIVRPLRKSMTTKKADFDEVSRISEDNLCYTL